MNIYKSSCFFICTAISLSLVIYGSTMDWLDLRIALNTLFKHKGKLETVHQCEKNIDVVSRFQFAFKKMENMAIKSLRNSVDNYLSLPQVITRDDIIIKVYYDIQKILFSYIEFELIVPLCNLIWDACFNNQKPLYESLMNYESIATFPNFENTNDDKINFPFCFENTIGDEPDLPLCFENTNSDEINLSSYFGNTSNDEASIPFSFENTINEEIHLSSNFENTNNDEMYLDKISQKMPTLRCQFKDFNIYTSVLLEHVEQGKEQLTAFIFTNKNLKYSAAHMHTLYACLPLMDYSDSNVTMKNKPTL